MSDNTVLNIGVGGDTVRDLARPNSSGAKTQVVQLDIGGASANSEQLITAGQQVMAVSVPVVLAADHTPLSIAKSVSNNVWGRVSSCTDLSTSTMATITSPPYGYRIKGFICHGKGDGYFFIQVNQVTVLSGRIRSTFPTLILTLPDAIYAPSGSVITLKVTNESGSTTDYEGTLLGE